MGGQAVMSPRDVPGHLDLSARPTSFTPLRWCRSAHDTGALSRVAQLVEQVTVNHRVGGSSPSSGVEVEVAEATVCRNTLGSLVEPFLLPVPVCQPPFQSPTVPEISWVPCCLFHGIRS